MNKIFQNRKKRCVSLMLVMIIFITSFGVFRGQAQAATSYPYLIKVNRAACTVTIYGKDSKGKYTVPIKAMLCSPGWDTPLGTYKTPAKYRWKLLMGDVWGQYSTRVVGGILFHSVWYYSQDPSTLSNRQFNNLGSIVSHGCIRLNVEDAKWIYDNCPLGTTVTIYDDKNNPGPLGKPEAIKLSSSSGQGYDPTDIWTKSNPYNDKKPTISGVKDQTVKYGSSVDLKSGVTAKSITGTDVTSKIKTAITYNGKEVSKVDTKQAGTYKVTYSVTDLLKRTTTKTATITVSGNDTKPQLSGVKNMTVGDVKLTRTLLLKNVTASWNGKNVAKKNIETKVETTKKKDVYKVTYSVTASNGKTASKTATITMDREGPVILGAENKMVEWDTKVTKKMALEGIKVSDNISKESDIKLSVTITKDEENECYNIVYKATDKLGNVTTEKAVYTILGRLRIEGATDREITKDTVVDEAFALEGVTAYSGNTDVSDMIEVEIIKEVIGYYTVNYAVMDDRGNVDEVSVIFTYKKEDTSTPTPTQIPETTQQPDETIENN